MHDGSLPKLPMYMKIVLELEGAALKTNVMIYTEKKRFNNEPDFFENPTAAASVAIALWNNETETKDQEDRGIFRENMV